MPGTKVMREKTNEANNKSAGKTQARKRNKKKKKKKSENQTHQCDGSSHNHGLKVQI